MGAPGTVVKPQGYQTKVPLLPQRILQTAHGILNFASGFFGFAIGLQLGITKSLASRLLYTARSLFRCAGETIFVHGTVAPSSFCPVVHFDVVRRLPLPTSCVPGQTERAATLGPMPGNRHRCGY